MGRGKIEIKMIENSTNRQVTYSKRRNGILKKAHELTVLCDAKVSLLLSSTTGKFHEYITPGTTTKEMVDQYQKNQGVDLWNTHYLKMQEKMEKLNEINAKLRSEIRQRIGKDDLSALSMPEIVHLETDINESLTLIRNRKYHKIKTQTDTCKKKVKNLEERHENLMHQLDGRCEESNYEVVENVGDYNSALAFANGDLNLYALAHLNIQHGGGFGSSHVNI